MKYTLYSVLKMNKMWMEIVFTFLIRNFQQLSIAHRHTQKKIFAMWAECNIRTKTWIAIEAAAMIEEKK